MADKLGDKTARLAGRLTLNPVKHIDPIGFIMLFIAKFGWAKPVPINPYNIRGDIKQGLLLISLAGPAMNLILAVTSAIILGIAGFPAHPLGQEFLFYMILINVVLAVFNLIPIPPLDGSKILAGILPGRQEWLLHMEQYGIIILILLVFTGAIGRIFDFFVLPIADFLIHLSYSLARI
ncbi:MAG: site-2 protease family protein [Peptococcaceae bacterium]|nr:site-2 protease family protein [Peptococcaceae bacterium]